MMNVYVNMEGCLDAWMHVFMYSLIIFFFVFKGIDIKRGGGNTFIIRI